MTVNVKMAFMMMEWTKIANLATLLAIDVLVRIKINVLPVRSHNFNYNRITIFVNASKKIIMFLV